jgi:hypothetical protein
MTGNRLDGNAAAGTLQAIFPFEMTLAVATCAGCGTASPLGAAAAFMSGMGTVVRCPACYNALIRVALVDRRYFLDLRGSRTLQFGADGNRPDP